ncbi:MAG: hypothetical protein EOP09_03245 [Proteobacteria bacterium]|nr:MAG: hypothetical protein EOP09_03245 [Pseudomonadota bacterium]
MKKCEIFTLGILSILSLSTSAIADDSMLFKCRVSEVADSRWFGADFDANQGTTFNGWKDDAGRILIQINETFYQSGGRRFAAVRKLVDPTIPSITTYELDDRLSPAQYLVAVSYERLGSGSAKVARVHRTLNRETTYVGYAVCED